MTDSVVKRRLKSLAQLRAEKEAKAAAAKERRLERDHQVASDLIEAAASGISLFMLQAYRRGPLVLPLNATYGREPDQEARRARFYADCAWVFGFDGWRLNYDDKPRKGEKEPGFGERTREIRQLDVDASINLASAPLEWLAAKGKLETHADAEGQRMVRYAVACKIRDVCQGADYAGLKGQAYDGGGGGGSGGGRPVTDHMVDCLKIISDVRASMSPSLYLLLVTVVCQDEWVWERVKPSKKRQALSKAMAATRAPAARLKLNEKIVRVIDAERWPVIEQLHKAMDKAAVTLRYMTAADYRKRWGSFTPLWTPPKRKKKARPPEPPAQRPD